MMCNQPLDRQKRRGGRMFQQMANWLCGLAGLVMGGCLLLPSATSAAAEPLKAQIRGTTPMQTGS